MELTTIWFILVAVLFIGYFVLEGFDFGVGMLVPLLSEDDTDRRVVINTVGPVWDGNEVWLITAGGALFWKADGRYWHRHAVKPGLTGLAQVRGLRGATENEEDLVNRVQADLEYVAGWSLWRDLRILVRTTQVMLHSNAY